MSYVKVRADRVAVEAEIAQAAGELVVAIMAHSAWVPPANMSDMARNVGWAASVESLRMKMERVESLLRKRAAITEDEELDRLEELEASYADWHGGHPDTAY